MRWLIAVSLFLTAAAGAAEISDSQTLAEAIEAVRAGGTEITYSTKLVEPWMRVRTNPASDDPVAALGEALAPYGLALERGPQGRWLVVEGEPPDRDLAAKKDLDPEPPEPEHIARPTLDEIKIVASRYSLFDRGSVGDQFLTGEEIRRLPHIADDAFRAFHRLPGAAASDFSAPFNLRGGTVEEVKVMLDGLELFEPYHMRTLFSPLSIVDPGIIDNAHVLSGGFTGQYGNHMSGVIDMVSEFPDGGPVHELGVSFVNSFVRSSGQLDNGGSYLVSARRGYLDLIADQVTDEGEELDPRYSDLFAKIAYPVSDRTGIAGHVLIARDNVAFADPVDGEESDDDSSLGYAWMTVDTEPNDRVRWRNVLFAGKVENQDRGTLNNFPYENIERFYDREVSVSGLQSDLNLRLDPSHMWVFGLRFRDLEADYNYQIDSLRQTDFANRGVPWHIQRDIVTSRSGSELGTYVRYRFRPTPATALELGLRWDKQTWTGVSDETQLSPRVAALIRVGERTDVRLGWGRYHQPQGIQDLQVEDGVTEYFPAEQSEHVVAGIRHIFRSGPELQVEFYNKHYSDLRPRFENVLDTYEYAAETDFDRIRVEPESAESTGVEITLRNRESERLDWWLNYTWSEAEDVIGGVPVPRSWDQRHAVTGNLSWRGDKWVFSLVGRYHTGWPRTPLLVTSILDAGGSLIAVDSDLSQRNRTDFDDYFRVDLRISRTVALSRGSFEYYFEFFNLFNTVNECCVSDHDLEIGPVVSALPNIDEFLPFFPSFGFVWTFGSGAE